MDRVPAPMARRIDKWRAEIDTIDLELVRLLNARAKCVVQLGKLKRMSKLPIYDEDRENAILSHACQANDGPLDDQAIYKIFRRIIYECLRLQVNINNTNIS